MDPITAPILLKTVDWLFGEGSKILQERRERREANRDAGHETAEPLTLPHVPTFAENSILSKEAALRSPIDETAWADSEANVRHLLTLLEIHTRNYQLAKQQYAQWGSALVPPIITHNLAEAENAIATTTKELQSVLSKVYGTKVAAVEVERA